MNKNEQSRYDWERHKRAVAIQEAYDDARGTAWISLIVFIAVASALLAQAYPDALLSPRHDLTVHMGVVIYLLLAAWIGSFVNCLYFLWRYRQVCNRYKPTT
jgi:hypothetical protein